MQIFSVRCLLLYLVLNAVRPMCRVVQSQDTRSSHAENVMDTPAFLQCMLLHLQGHYIGLPYWSRKDDVSWCPVMFQSFPWPRDHTRCQHPFMCTSLLDAKKHFMMCLCAAKMYVHSDTIHHWLARHQKRFSATSVFLLVVSQILHCGRWPGPAWWGPHHFPLWKREGPHRTTWTTPRHHENTGSFVGNHLISWCQWG